jgi:uncharacterized protein YjdB
MIMNKTVKTLLLSIMLMALFSGCGVEFWHPDYVPSTGGGRVSVTGVTLNKTAVSLNVGGMETLSVYISPSNATNQSVTWRSSNTSVAEISSGNVYGVSDGSATITVTTADGNKTASCTVTVSSGGGGNVSVIGVSLDKTTSSITIGGTYTLTATVAPANATNKNVTWSSSNTAVATVSSNGLVSGVSAGSATITVTTSDGGYTASCYVNVNSGGGGNVSVIGVSLNKTAVSLSVGGSETLAAVVMPDNATNKNVSWRSSNTAVATVSSSGVVSGVSAGSATITVTTVDGGKTATCSVTVTNIGGANTINLGNFTVENNDVQKGWCTNGTDEITTSLSINDLIAAKFLVLELSKVPNAFMQIIWQGDGDSWAWNQRDGILSNNGEPNAELGVTITQSAGKVILRIELSKAFINYYALLICSKVKFFLSYYSPDIEGLGITRAYLEL